MDAVNTRTITLELPGTAGPIEATVSFDDARLLEALLAGRPTASVRASVPDGGDTTGHAADAGVIELDVEGHAIALRLPRTADVELIRERLSKVVGVTLVAGVIALGVGLTYDPAVFPPASQVAPGAAQPPSRQEVLLRINAAPESDVVIPLGGEDARPPAAPRPGEAAKPF